MEILKFKRHHGIYTPGDIAGFAPDAAARLLHINVAEKIDDQPVPVLSSETAPATEEPRRRGRSAKAES